MSGIRRRLLYAKPKEAPNYLCFTALESGTITFTIASAVNTTAVEYMSYSIDGGSTWVRLDNVNNSSVSITTPTLNVGDKVMWKGKGRQLGTSDTVYASFSSTCKFDISGNINSLLFENTLDITSISDSYIHYKFGNVFRNSSVVHAGELVMPIISMGSTCRSFYRNLFRDCIYLVECPELIAADSEYCYSDTFRGCTSLATAPDLSGITFNKTYVFQNMFYGCTSLVNVSTMPSCAMTKGCCSSMFYGCTSLLTAPALPAMTLAASCYASMFRNCSNLINAPQRLPAKIAMQSCYDHMFNACTSLTAAPAIDLEVLANQCCMQMFDGCTALTSIPELPVTTLANGCYWGMFTNTTSFVGEVTLPALTVPESGYRNMFSGSHITWIKILATDISASNCVNGLTNYLTPNVNTSILVKNINATWTTAVAPSNWKIIYFDTTDNKYYLDKDKEIECDKFGIPIYQYIYVNNGLVFFLDAIKQNERGFSSWVDFSGNYQLSTKVESMSGTHSTFIDFYRYAMSFKSEQGVKFIGDISNGFTIEFIYQPRYTNYDNTIQDTSRSGAQSMLVGFSNSEYFLQANGQLKLQGGSNIGTDVFDNSKIMHITWTYDGISFKRYVDGVNDIDVSGTLNTSGLANVFIFGYSDWSWITRLCFNDLRVYSRALTQAEITSNYNTDITRFGTENVL